MSIDYKSEVLRVYSNAKCYHTSTILHTIEVYHVGYEKDNTIYFICKYTEWATNKMSAWQKAYQELVKQNKITPPTNDKK